MNRRLRRPTTRIPTQTHARRIEKVAREKAEQETRETTRREKTNTVLSVVANAFAIPALILGLLTYMDQKENNEETDRKEAGRVSYFFLAGRNYLEHGGLVIENRSLSPAWGAAIVEEGRSPKHSLGIGVIPACMQLRYDFDKKTAGAAGKAFFYSSLYFYNSLGATWRAADEGTSKVDDFPDFYDDGKDKDFAEEWHLSPSYKPLDSCA
jgi:hypothetical protein